HLELKELLLEQGKHIDVVHFPLTAVTSLLNLVQGTSGVEIATVGNEGLVGLSLSWGIDTFNPREFVQCQVPGDALVMDADTFASKSSAGGELTWLVHRYTQAFVTQIGQQVACNGLHSIEERCRSPRSASRWPATACTRSRSAAPAGCCSPMTGWAPTSSPTPRSSWPRCSGSDAPR